MNITIIGLGYVGLTTSLVFANANFNVTCIDKDEEKIKQLKRKKMPFYEKDCQELLINSYNKLTFTTNYKKISKSDVIFICVGTPLNSKNDLDISSIIDVIKNIDKNILNNKIITICIRSTILPGTCNKLRKYLKHCNVNILHNPEFLSQGTAINDFINAKRIVIGSDNNESLQVIINLYNKILNFYNVRIPIVIMNTKEAEMVKFMANSYLAIRLSFINEMSNLCKKLDINVENVVEGVKYDERIGGKYFKSGIGYGGSCLPKDTRAILNYSNKKKSSLKLVKSAIEINDLQLKKCFEEIKKVFPNLSDKIVAILGLTFKANTDDIRNSCSLYLTDRLINEKANINVYDPKGIDSFKKIYGNKIKYYNNIDECILNCDVIIIATEWENIKSYDFDSINTTKKVFIYDFKNCINLKNKNYSNITYWSLGGN
ncbi:MAG: UDP-glucose/GDP-mannose dehydrogenase family protein [bacterium]|nr:UDP-glucose/GDP-mannose dehydrogenase family protein [bacterium]